MHFPGHGAWGVFPGGRDARGSTWDADPLWEHRMGFTCCKWEESAESSQSEALEDLFFSESGLLSISSVVLGHHMLHSTLCQSP